MLSICSPSPSGISDLSGSIPSFWSTLQFGFLNLSLLHVRLYTAVIRVCSTRLTITSSPGSIAATVKSATSPTATLRGWAVSSLSLLTIPPQIVQCQTYHLFQKRIQCLWEPQWSRGCCTPRISFSISTSRRVHTVAGWKVTWPTPRPKDLLPPRTSHVSMGSPESKAWKGGKVCVRGVYWVSAPKKQWYEGSRRIPTEGNQSWMLRWAGPARGECY